MLVEASHRLNIKTIILDAPGSPAKQINALHAHIDGSFTDPVAIENLAKDCDIITIEIEHVDTEVLEKLEGTPGLEVNHLPFTLWKEGETTRSHCSFGLTRLPDSTFVENDTHHPGQICSKIASIC